MECKRAQVSLKATIDVPMPGTIIEQNGDGLLEDSHMPVGWHTLMVPSDNVAFIITTCWENTT